MDKNYINESTGLNGLNGEFKAEFLSQIWNCSTYQMCHAQMIFDHGAPVDYIILDINTACERAYGFARDQAINKRITELFPCCASMWIEKCGEAVRLGKDPLSFEYIFEHNQRYEVQVFPLRSGDQFITMARNTYKHNEEEVGGENDPTSNKTANEALVEQVELLNVLMDYNPSLIFLKDECGRYVYLNRTYAQQFVGSKNWYGKTDFDFWSKESAELFRANDLAVLEAGRVIQYLEDSKDQNGTRYCWLNYKFPYTDSKNRKYSGGIGIDITKRILAEEALHKAEEELKRHAEELKTREEETLELIDGFTEGSWIVDRLAGTFICSEKWSKRIGLDRVPEKERFSFTHTLTHTEDTADGNSIEHCMESGLTRFDLEYRIKTVDSGYIWTQNRGKIVYDTKGNAIKVYAATIDITGRKRAEEALREKTRQLDEANRQKVDILESISDCFYALDKNLRFTYVNKAAEDIWGLSRAILIGRRIEDVFPNLINISLSKFHQVLEEQIPQHYEVFSKVALKWGDMSVYPAPDGISVYFHDITERKRAEKEREKLMAVVTEERERLETIINSIDDEVWISDAAGNLVQLNPTAQMLHGLKADGKPISGIVESLEILEPDGTLRLKENSPMLRALKGEIVSGEEYIRHLNTGELRYRMYNCAPIRDNLGNITGTVAVAKDITERNRMENELAFQAHVLDSIQDAICAVDEDFHITYWNKMAEKVFGWTESEAIGSPSKEIFRMVLPSNREESITNLLKNNGYKGEGVYRRKNGKVIYTNVVCSVIRNSQGEYAGNVSTYRDITERKQAEEEIRKANDELAKRSHEIQNERQRFFDVLETLPVMICLITPDYHIPFSNKAFRQKFGEANGRCYYDFCCGFSEPCIFCESLIPLKTGQVHNWEFTSPDGDTIIDAYDFPFSDNDGSPLILEMDVDITERKRAEAALRESENRAHELVRVLEDADKSKNQFISVLSHELRNPLAAITVGLSVLEVSTDTRQNESVKEIIKRQVNQLCKLVDDLLDLTRITQNKIKLKKESIILNELVRDALKDIRPEYDKKGLRLWDKILTQPIFLYADPVRIAQCVGNLLHNAAKFTPTNGNVWVSLKMEKNEAILSVQDDGIGISQGILAKLFQPFTQADDSLDRYDNNGLGLGLSIVKGIVELHDGYVTAASEGLGKGSLFTIRLPISADNSDKQDIAAIKKAMRSFRILIIEDNKDLADLLQSMFSMLGHEAYAAYDGIEGITKAREIKPDIIFCDIGLPGKNGFEVAKIIRNDAILKNVFLISLSGYAGERDVDQAIKSGFDRHLAKPIDMDMLKKILSEDVERQE